MQLPPQILRDAAEYDYQQKERFFGMISHELRDLLSGAIGFSDLLARSPLNSEQREYLELIRKNNNSLSALLEDILEFVRLDSKTFSLRYSAVNLRELFAEVRDLYLHQASSKGVELTLSIDAFIPHAVRSDRVRLHQILRNLVGNAIKFTPQGKVNIAARCTEFSTTAVGTEICRLRIEVHDNGIGIPPEYVVNLFQPFVQVNLPYASAPCGSGLGLAICRRLTELMGGEIGLERSSSAGSTFYLTLELECMNTSVAAPTALA